jgi:hypothetical protein
VIVDDADGIDAASSRARILAGAPDASLADWAVAAEDTFRPAGHLRVTHVVLLAGTADLAIDDNTLGIGSAGVWVTRVLGLWGRDVAVSLAQEERVTGVAYRHCHKTFFSVREMLRKNKLERFFF